jgi:hypothetical protein
MPAAGREKAEQLAGKPSPHLVIYSETPPLLVTGHSPLPSKFNFRYSKYRLQ